MFIPLQNLAARIGFWQTAKFSEHPFFAQTFTWHGVEQTSSTSTSTALKVDLNQSHSVVVQSTKGLEKTLNHTVLKIGTHDREGASDEYTKSPRSWGFVKFTELLPCVKAKVHKWARDLKAGRDNVHDDSRSGRPSVIADDVVASVEAKILENRRFTISTLSNDFPEVSRSVLYKIVSEKLNFKKLCSRWVPELLTEDHKNKRFGCSLNFLTRFKEEGDAILSQIVTGDETWVSHVVGS
ncbi:hypothetical protein AVEN_90494-1 [Araneus ventricosus]|uniref:Histone-lysine N-methyltransferase SETMAR n=1 Tax=Araneus ventricosus TaxID=182803 RepID=A0A4Y2IG72_ARAVE|nr:hypothetical protein AVEN_90494-1 [Araneus ventricosus]